MKKIKDYDKVLMNSFWKNCGHYPPHTVAKLRKVLARTAGETVNPKVVPEDFPENHCKQIIFCLKSRNHERTRLLVLQSMKEVALGP